MDSETIRHYSHQLRMNLILVVLVVLQNISASIDESRNTDPLELVKLRQHDSLLWIEVATDEFSYVGDESDNYR